MASRAVQLAVLIAATTSLNGTARDVICSLLPWDMIAESFFLVL